MRQIIYSQFMEHKMAVVGLVIIFFFVLLAILSPLMTRFTKLDPTSQNIFHRYSPPLQTNIDPIDSQEEKLEIFIQHYPKVSSKIVTRLINNNLLPGDVDPEEALFEMLVRYNKEPDYKKKVNLIESPEIAQFQQLWNSFSTTHILGTDELGRDFLMRLIWGTRVSLSVGLWVALISMLIGVSIGSIAGYYGGWIDMILSRIIDTLLSLPLLPLMIVLAAVDFNKIPFFNQLVGSENESVVKVIFILCLFSWMKVARLMRGSILSLREREFVLAAKTIGVSNPAIIFLHIIPNAIAPMLVAVTLNIGESILSEAALSFLGLGIQPPMPSWGNILFNALEHLHHSPILAILPGLLILITVVSFNFIGDGLQNAIDPKAIKR